MGDPLQLQSPYHAAQTNVSLVVCNLYILLKLGTADDDDDDRLNGWISSWQLLWQSVPALFVTKLCQDQQIGPTCDSISDTATLSRHLSCFYVVQNRDADADASFVSIHRQTRTQPCVQLQTWTHLTEFVNCTYVMSASKAAIFEFQVIVLTWCETSLMCLLLLIFSTGDIS